MRSVGLPCLNAGGEADLVRCGAIVVILYVLNASALLRFRTTLISSATNGSAKRVTKIHSKEPSLFRGLSLHIPAH